MTRQEMGACLGMLLAGSFLLVSIFYSLPSNVLATRQGETARVLSLSLAPQSWAFFTKDPAEEEFHLYRRDGNEWIGLSKFPQSRPENLFGVSRDQRSQGVEFAIVADLVENWHECAEYTWGECLESAIEIDPQPIINVASNPSICGEVALLVTEPTRWSFRDAVSDDRFVSEIAVVNSKC